MGDILTFENGGITYSGYISDGSFVLGYDSNQNGCINRATTGRVYIPPYCVINGYKYYIRKLSKYSFFNTSISHVTVPYTVEFMDRGSFEQCLNLEFVDFSSSRCSVCSSFLFSRSDKISIIKFPHTIEMIEEYIFNTCTSLKSIVIPALKSISIMAFKNCKLEEIYYCGNNDISFTFDFNVKIYVPYSYNGNTFAGINVEKRIFECEIPKLTCNDFNTQYFLFLYNIFSIVNISV